MRTELIEIGKTYVGRKGKPRTVSNKISRYGGGSFDVEYHNGDPTKKHVCWYYTFAGWAIGEEHLAAEEIRRKAVVAAAPELLEALKGFVDLFDGSDMCATSEDAKCVKNAIAAIAKAEGK